MNLKTYSISVTKKIPASVDAAWDSWKTASLYQSIHTVYKAEIDFRVGGLNKIQYYPDKAVGETLIYQEIVPREKLVFAWQEHPLNSATVTFVAKRDETEICILQACQENPEWISNCLDGWAWVLDSMEHYFLTGTGLQNDEWRKIFGGYTISKVDQV